MIKFNMLFCKGWVSSNKKEILWSTSSKFTTGKNEKIAKQLYNESDIQDTPKLHIWLCIGL